MTHIIIFDDEPERVSKAQLIEKQTGVSVMFACLAEKEPLAVVVETIGGFREEDVRLIIVDHFLEKAKLDASVHKGASVVPRIRESWPSIPVFAVTAAKKECSNEQSSVVYEAIFDWDHFQELIEMIPSLLDGYDQLSRITTIEDFIDALAPSDTSKPTVHQSLPTKIRSSVGEPVFYNHAFRWIYRTLIRKPGFLLDKDWVALTLGVKPEFIDQFLQSLQPAAYSGLFANEHKPRWWKDKIYGLCYPDAEPTFDPVQKVAQAKFGVATHYITKCARCDEEWPEILGYYDDASYQANPLERIPLHLKCSVQHPGIRPEAYYEEIRIMIEE